MMKKRTPNCGIFFQFAMTNSVGRKNTRTVAVYNFDAYKEYISTPKRMQNIRIK
jgi:hypothetical protein